MCLSKEILWIGVECDGGEFLEGIMLVGGGVGGMRGRELL